MDVWWKMVHHKWMKWLQFHIQNTIYNMLRILLYFVVLILSVRCRFLWSIYLYHPGFLYRYYEYLRPRQNGRHFPNYILKCIFLKDNVYISIGFHRRLFPKIKFTIFQHLFRQWLGAGQATSHYLNQWWLVYWRIYSSPGLSDLRLLYYYPRPIGTLFKYRDMIVGYLISIKHNNKLLYTCHLACNITTTHNNIQALNVSKETIAFLHGYNKHVRELKCCYAPTYISNMPSKLFSSYFCYVINMLGFYLFIVRMLRVFA